ncbi:MAG: PKD domain-containing protein, partial [Flammeovirgaceae bacterium]|nr:PKD domain-containing protein [Flammeovirgaceae bacterium]MDW8288864.1 PKD domain-containing protein [Flammeovirgaceae bacterium]
MKSTFLKALLVTFLLLPFMGCKDDDKAPAPVANFSFTPTSPKAGEEVIFIDESTNATSYEWNFGDNTTSTQKNPRKTYSKEGT